MVCFITAQLKLTLDMGLTLSIMSGQLAQEQV